MALYKRKEDFTLLDVMVIGIITLIAFKGFFCHIIT